MTITEETPGTQDDRPGRRPIAPWIALGVAAVVVGLVVTLAVATPNLGETADSPLIGRPAPEATGTLDDGTPFDLSRRKGSWVFLNFFDPACIPCIQEHPELVKFDESQDALGDDGAELYAVIVRGSREEVDEFFEERGGDWPAIYSDNNDFPVAFGVAKVPETWIIDPSGVVQLRLIAKVTSQQLNEILQQFKEQYG